MKKYIAGTKVKCGFMKLFCYVCALHTGLECNIYFLPWTRTKGELRRRK